jgi:hypothetical protein
MPEEEEQGCVQKCTAVYKNIHAGVWLIKSGNFINFVI